MGKRFRGWPEQANAVLLQLGGEPSRETRERVRRDREAQVRAPMIDLLSDLADASSERIALFRAAVAADESGRALQDLVASLAADGHEVFGDVMSRVPRGYPSDHPRAGLLRHRSLIAVRVIESEAIHDVGPVYRACERLRALLTWLADHTAAGP